METATHRPSLRENGSKYQLGPDSNDDYRNTSSFGDRSQITSNTRAVSRCRSEKAQQEFNPEKEAADERYAMLQAIFQVAEEDGRGGLDIDEFKIALKKTVGYMMTNNQIELLFMKVDANCDGRVDWEEYVTYYLLEYQERTLMIERLRDRPFPPETKDINTRHRETIVRVAIYPTVHKKASTNQCSLDYYTARYVSLSREGIVTFWTPKMKQIKSYMTHPHVDRSTQPWLTDFVCAYNVSMLAATSTDRDISVFDIQANLFKKRYYITGIDSCITCMDYWADIKDLNKSVMVWGDTSGSVYVLVFECALKGGLFGAVGGKQTAYKKISLPEVLRGFHLGVKGFKIGKIHDNWVSNIKYIPELDLFASCCQSNDTSMYIGDYNHKKKLSTYFKVNKGLLTFDYCAENNIIATGGMDYLIRIWNPYVNSKPVVVLKGHCKPVTHIVINSSRGQIVSIDKGRNVRVFDMKDQTCVQQLSGRVIKVGPFPISSMCFNPVTQKLVLATNTLAMLERSLEDEKSVEITSHEKAVQGAMYNKTFKFVVSCCRESVVSVWDLNTGEKVIQFVNAHKRVERGVEIPIEITAMTFDGPGRRLITGARDGSVKIWNFNNGNCLQQFTTPEALEITGLVSTRQRIYVTGWCQLVHIYIDGASEDYRKNWKNRHKDDILCIASMEPNLVATGSYDGDVIIWAKDTGQVYCTLNVNKGILPIMENMNKKEQKQEIKEPVNEEIHSPQSEAMQPLEVADWKSAVTTKTIRTGLGLLSKVRGGIIRTESTSGRPESRFSRSPESPVEHPLLSSYETVKKSENTKREEYDDICKKYEAAVEKIIFLESRDANNKDTAVLVTSGAEGWIRFWSVHHEGGLLGQFNAGHRIGESVHALATDEKNNFLFTGDTFGYIKTWDISEFCVSNRHTSKERLARWQWLLNTFTYLRFEWRGKDMPKYFISKGMKPHNIGTRPPPMITEPKKTLKWPLLVNSYRAHTKAINSVEYVDDRSVIVTASSDCSVRVWTLSGVYIGTFGEIWSPLDNRPKKQSTEGFRIPKDIRRVASARTFRVLNNGTFPRWNLAIQRIREEGLEKLLSQYEPIIPREEEPKEDSKTEVRLQTSNILGKSYKRKIRHKLPKPHPKLIETPSSVAVYHALSFVNLTDIDNMFSADTLREMKERRFGSNVRDRLRGFNRKKEQGPAILEVFNKVTKKPTLPVQPYKKKPSKIKKVHGMLQEKVASNLPPILTESETKQVHGNSKHVSIKDSKTQRKANNSLSSASNSP